MTASDLTLSSDVRVGSQYVYIKQLWADQWELIQGLHCAGASWGTVPTIGQATIERPFGLGMYPGDVFASYKSALEIKNWLVKIEYYSVDGLVGPLLWYGVAGIEEKHRHDRVNDNGTMKVSGQQVWHCYEIGYWLDRFPIVTGWFDHPDLGPTEIGAAPVFNSRGVGNRSTIPESDCYLFANLAGEDNADYWSSRDIVEYLVVKFRPQLGIETGSTFNITIENPEDLPDWDKPEISVHGTTLWESLSRVLDRRRGLGGYFYVSGSDLVLKVYTITDEPIALNGEEGETLAANSTQYNLIVDHRPDLGTSLLLNSVDQYDRVILEGRKRRAVATFEKDISESDGFDRDWTDADETAYNEGASNQTGYGALADADAQTANSFVRMSPDIAHTYQRFKLVDDWDGKTTSGLTDKEPVLVDDEDETKVFGNWPEGWRFLPALPLYLGTEYSGTSIGEATTPLNDSIDEETPWMPPMVFVPTIGDADKWFEATSGAFGALDNADDKVDWSIRLRVEDERPRFWMDVSGQRQHVIASADFTAEPEDLTIDPMYDWKTFLVTVCLEENRRVQVKYPEELGGAGADIPAIREKYIDIGDGFCLDYVTPQTVLGISRAAGTDVGELMRSTGGGYVRDDRPKMRAMATQLYVFYSAVRKVLRVEKTGLTDELWLGDYVTQLGSSTDSSDLTEAVGTVVTQISVSFPQGQNGSMPGPPTQQWETAQGEIDRLIVPVRRRRR